MWTSRLIRKSLLPTFGAPPSTSMPPGVSTRGAMMSSGIGLASSSSAPSVKAGMTDTGGTSPLRSRAGPLRSTCRRQSRSASELQPLQRPARAQHGGVVLADGLPALVAAHAAVMHHADVVADRGARALEAGPVIFAAFAHRRRQDIGDRRLCRSRDPARMPTPGKRRHGVDQLGEVAQIDLDPRTVVADRDQPLEAALVID